MLQNTPYDSILSMMGGGGGALANGGVGISSATGNMASQAFGANVQNTALNQQSQDTANQQAQYNLDQDRLGAPALAAKRELSTTADTQDAQILKESGMSAKRASIAAKEAEAIAGMTKAQRAQHDIEMEDFADASSLINSKGFDLNNPEHNKTLQDTLNRGKQRLDRPVTEADLPRIQAMGNMAVNNMATIRAMNANQALGQTKREVAEIQAGAHVEGAQIRADQSGENTKMITNTRATPANELAALENKFSKSGPDSMSVDELQSYIGQEMAKRSAEAKTNTLLNMQYEAEQDPKKKAEFKEKIDGVDPDVKAAAAVLKKKLAAGATPAAAAPKPGAPKAGDVVKGWTFKGGDPSDEANWSR